MPVRAESVLQQQHQSQACCASWKGSAALVWAGEVMCMLQVGVQEKTTFVQNGMQLKGAALYSSVIQLAAAIQVFLFVTAILVLYHHAAPAATNKRSNDSSQLLPDVISQEA